MKSFIIIFTILIFQSLTLAQNLLPNGSFESITMDFDYTDPVSAFMYLDSWFQANYYPSGQTHKSLTLKIGFFSRHTALQESLCSYGYTPFLRLV